MVLETLSNAAGNIADESEKYCPWFLKTLPIRMENIAHDFFKRCPSFWKTMGNVSQNDGQCFAKTRAIFFIGKINDFPRNKYLNILLFRKEFVYL